MFTTGAFTPFDGLEGAVCAGADGAGVPGRAATAGGLRPRPFATKALTILIIYTMWGKKRGAEKKTKSGQIYSIWACWCVVMWLDLSLSLFLFCCCCRFVV